MENKEVRLIDANALWTEIEKIYREHFQTSSYQFIHDFFKAMFRKIKKPQPSTRGIYGHMQSGLKIIRAQIVVNLR